MYRLLPIVLTILSLAVFSACFAGSGGAPPAEQPMREKLVKGNSTFAVGLYGELGAAEGNIFFSPYSISSALAMTYAGARGATGTEMRAALHLQLDQPELHRAFRNLNRELMDTARKGGQKLNIANGLVLTGGNVANSFKTILKNDYDAEIFSGGLEAINGWVKLKTEGKIEKILDQLNPNSVAVLLNAIYFKGAWESRFEKSSTHDAPFNVSPGKQVTVPLMHQKGKFRMLAEDGFQAVSMPYKGGKLSMVVLLPNAVDGLPALERRLTERSLKGWLEHLDRQSPRDIDLFLPRFKLETGYDLAKPCRNLGIKDAFLPGRADFRGMGWPVGDLWISQIKHRAFVEVNEEGTEAAAATIVEMATKSFRPDPVFRADHPFLFVIRDSQSDTILFLGRMVNPGR